MHVSSCVNFWTACCNRPLATNDFKPELKTFLFGQTAAQRIAILALCALYKYSYSLTYLLTKDCQCKLRTHLQADCPDIKIQHLHEGGHAQNHVGAIHRRDTKATHTLNNIAKHTKCTVK